MPTPSPLPSLPRPVLRVPPVPRSKPRRSLAPAAVALLLLAVASLAAVPGAAADEVTVRTAEAQRYRAMVQGDVEVLESFLDDDLVYTHSHGGVDDKAGFLASLRSGELVYRKIQLGGSRVEVWGDAAVVTGLAVLEVEAGDRRVTAPVRFTAVYRRGDDHRWRLLAWQTTPSGEVESRPLEAAPAGTGADQGVDQEDAPAAGEETAGEKGPVAGEPPK